MILHDIGGKAIMFYLQHDQLLTPEAIPYLILEAVHKQCLDFFFGTEYYGPFLEEGGGG